MTAYDSNALELAGDVMEARQRLGLTQVEFGKRCWLSGARISQIERAVKPTPEATARRIRRVLGL